MNFNQKAIKNINTKGIYANETNGTVYVCIDGVELELSEFEINYQASEYDKKVENGYFD